MRESSTDAPRPQLAQALTRVRSTPILRDPRRYVVAAVAIVAVISTLPWINRPMFRDEAATLYSAHLGWSHLIAQSQHVDFVLLPYYAIMHFWLYASGSIIWGRLLSELAFGLTIYLVGRLAGRLGGTAAAIAAAILCATNPSMVHAAIYLRPYALSALAATAACSALLAWLETEERKWIWLFAAASIAALLLQMFSVLAPLAMLFVAVLLRREFFLARWKTIAQPLCVMALVALLFVPISAAQRAQVAWIKLNIFGSHAYLGPAGGPGGYEQLITWLVVISVAIWVIGLIRQRITPSRLKRDEFLMVLGWALLPAALLILASLAVRPIYVLRYVTASAPAMAIVLGVVLVRAWRVISKNAAWNNLGLSAGGVALAVFLYVVGAVPTTTHLSENLSAAANYVATNIRPGEVLALPDHSITTAVNYYLEREHADLPQWPQLNDQLEIEWLDLKVSQSTEHSNPPSAVWLVEDGSTHGLSNFERMLYGRGYALVQSYKYGQANVLLFKLY